MTDRIDLVYAKIENEQLGPISSCVVCDENRIGQRCGRLYMCFLR